MSLRQERPTCFIHIGPPKTGSSTISHFVENNAAEFEKHGVYIPKMTALSGRPQNGHGIFANVREIDGQGQLKPGSKLWPELEAVAAEGKLNILLTSESFTHSFRHADRLEAMVKFFERHDYNVRIVAYLRDQPSSLNSTYVQTQKRLMKRWTFEEFLQDAAENGRVDPWRWLEHIIDNPRVSLEVGSFERAAKGGLERDFARRVGLPDDAEIKPVDGVRNPNAGAKAVYAAQRILAETEHDIFKSAHYKSVYRRFREHFEKLGWNDSPYVALDQDTYQKIRDFYRDSNERFANRFLGAPWSELSPDRSYAKSTFDPATADPDELREVEEVVADIVAAIKAEGAELPKRKIKRSTLGQKLRQERREARRAMRAAAGKTVAGKKKKKLAAGGEEAVTAAAVAPTGEKKKKKRKLALAEQADKPGKAGASGEAKFGAVKSGGVKSGAAASAGPNSGEAKRERKAARAQGGEPMRAKKPGEGKKRRQAKERAVAAE